MTSRWPSVPLADVLKEISRPEPVRADGEYRLLGARWYAGGLFVKDVKSGSQIQARTVYRVHEGDFVYNRLFAWKGSFALASAEDDGCFVSNEFPCFRVDEMGLDGRFLQALFRRESAWNEALGLSTGGTPTSRNRLKVEKLLAMRIPLPLLAEQRRIVARIGRVAGRVAAAGQVRAAAQDELRFLRAGLISRLIEGLDVRGRLEDVLLEKPRNGWSARCDNADGGTAVLALSAITGFAYRGSEVKRTSAPVDPGAHYWLRPGDLLITRSNTPELVGHAAIYDGAPSPCIYPDLMMKLVPDPRLASVEFVHLWLQARPAREHVRSLAKGTSPSMKKISQGTVLRIPYPSGLSLIEQGQIVASMKRAHPMLDVLAATQVEVARAIDSMMPSVLAAELLGGQGGA